jgi:hypothetical protein
MGVTKSFWGVSSKNQKVVLYFILFFQKSTIRMNRQVSGHQFKKKKKLMLRIKFPQEEN